jgi:hypothetical protein
MNNTLMSDFLLMRTEKVLLVRDPRLQIEFIIS